MRDCILIKGNRYGLTIILDNNVLFSNVLEALKNKITELKKYFKNAKIAITFKGRDLTIDQEKELIKIITTNSDMEITCIINEENETRNELNNDKDSVSELLANIAKMAMFYKGTIRSGQEVIFKHSVIVLGDINPGGKIIANGNVIILGALKGTVHVKKQKDKYPFIVALSMNPMQLKIGHILGRAPDKQNYNESADPQIAYVNNEERICIERLNSSIYRELDMYNDNLIKNIKKGEII